MQQEQLAHQQYLAAMEKAEEEALRVVPEEPVAAEEPEQPSKAEPLEFQSPKAQNPAERQPFALIEAAHDEPVEALAEQPRPE